MTNTSFAQQTENSLPSCLLVLRKCVAFTLAEVLITLGIIGIVAAMTIPGLIVKHQKQVTVNKLKREYSIINNVFRMAQKDYDIISIPKSGNHNELMKTFLETNFLPYVEIGNNYGWMTFNDLYKDSSKVSSSHGGHFIELNDGTILAFAFGTALNTNGELVYGKLTVFMDINGKKGPNKSGHDIFQLSLNQNYMLNFNCSTTNRKK